MIHMKSEYEVKSGIYVTVFINRGVKETFRFLKYHPIQSPNAVSQNVSFCIWGT
jgi:hypothetical protein